MYLAKNYKYLGCFLFVFAFFLLVFQEVVMSDDISTKEGPYQLATFAGGCFWCMEPPFDKVNGVISTTSGYTGGSSKNPTYKDVSSGRTTHAEAIQIKFDPGLVSYKELLDVYWRNIDPLAKDRQFCDTGKQYRSAIFYHDQEQKKLAQETKAALEKQAKFSAGIKTEIKEATEFYPAEEYHQDYYKKNPISYKRYRIGCRRDARLRELWG